MGKYQGWHSYANSAKQDVLFTQFAYKDSQVKQDALQNLAREIAPNHELLLFSDYLDDTKDFEYRCAVFIDRENKEIVCANAGTRLGVNSKGLSDLVDDANLVLHLEPYKLKSAHKLNEMILENLGDEAANYKFHFTGHSLGAAMAQIQSTDLFLQLHESGRNVSEISTITFDNPGAKPIIDKMLKSKGLVSDMTNIEHVTVNNRPNFINTLNPQVGEVFQIVPDDQKPFDMFEKIIALIAKVMAACIPEPFGVLAKVSEWLSYGHITKQVDDHKLENFDKVIIRNSGKVMSLEEVTGRPKYRQVEYDDGLFSELQKLKEKNPAVGKQEFAMYNLDAPAQRITCSKVELDKVKKDLAIKDPKLRKSSHSIA